MAKRAARRFWSDDEKAMICRQARMPGVSVSQVARRYDVNSNLVFKWLRDGRYVPTADGASAEGLGPTVEPEARFLPVEIVEHVRPAAVQESAEEPSVVEIELACGHRLRIVGGYDPDAVARLVRSLSS